MKFELLTEQEFQNFANNHPLFSFHQTKEWAELKQHMGWKYYFVGLKKKDKIEAASLILSKTTPIGKNIFYAPRGFLLDYKNEKIVKKFTEEIRKFAKKEQAIFVKIDPYLIHVERDINGNVVKDGIDNSKVVNTLKSIGYKHHGFNLTFGKELQPRWIYVLSLKGKTQDEIFNNFSSDTKRYINRAIKNALEVEEVTYDNLEEFSNIMSHTSQRRGFIDRPLSYYQDMYKTLSPNIKILSCYLDTKKAINTTKEAIKAIELEVEDAKQRMDETGSKKSKDNYNNKKRQLEQLEKKYDELKELQDKHGSKIVMASSMFLLFGHEVLYLYSGSYEKFMKYNAQYLIQWEIIKYAIDNKYDRYNFYGIEGNFNKENNDTYGIYEFKRGFDGNVVEFIGEFDLVVSGFYYTAYNLAFKLYRGIKHFMFRLKGGKK